ncbi:RING finger protein [Citrus sinensis]|uniref:RING finger protein n=2 Tax=Citrus sinensis TaxID=2711 RepID=A0ACB8KPQ4_CITSI|nr:RING finger protein [Citrus sinensis]
MEIEVSESSALSLDVERKRDEEKEKVRVKRKTLEAVLQQCQRALELLSNGFDEDDNDVGAVMSEEETSREGSSNQRIDREADELCDLLRSRVECPDFLDKLEYAQLSGPPNNIEEGSSWDMVSDNDLWESGNIDLDREDYVLVSEEDIVDGIACFMAAYLLSLKQAKACKLYWDELSSNTADVNLTPNQLQEALSKTFSVKKRKGKLRKAWDGSKVIYNVASWGATAVGISIDCCVIKFVL